MGDKLDDVIYLDHHATTPVDESVFDEMAPYFTEKFGNPASDDHRYGVEAKRAVKTARERISEAFNCRPEEIIFTSGATESDNLAIRGVAEYAQKNGKGSHIITSEVEHDAVLKVCENLKEEGFDVTRLSTDDQGRIDLDEVRKEIREETILISVMAANNEIGTIQPISEIGQMAKESQTLFHTDAVQAVGKEPLDVQAQNIDLMSVSGHKIYGPKGVGALYIRRRNPKVKLEGQIVGGGHERGFRSGTLNVPSIVGFGKAVQLAEQEREQRVSHLENLQSHMLERLQSELDDVTLNGHPKERLPNNINVSFIGVENKALVRNLQPEIAISAGSACTTDKVEASHVLSEISTEEERWHSAVRFGLGKDTTIEEIDHTVDEVVSAVNRLRNIQFG